MIRCRRTKTLVILTLFLVVTALSQDKQVTENKNKKLREEILAIYQASGEPGLRNFYRKSKKQITNKFVVDFAKAGAIYTKEEWLNVCEIIAKEIKNEKISADISFQWGVYFRLKSNYNRALDQLDKVFSIYNKINDPGGQGSVYREKGYIYIEISDNGKATEMLDKAMHFFKITGDGINQGNIYKKKGDIYFYTDDYAKAHEMYDRALQLFDKNEYLLGIGNIYFQKGLIHFYTGDNQQAFKMYDTALDFFKKGGDLVALGNIYRSLGECYVHDGNNPMAHKMYAKALYYFKKLGNLIGLGNVYKSEANLYFYTGDNSRALKLYTKALGYYEEAREIFGQGNVYRSIGDVYSIKGEYSSAEAMYNKALPFYEKTGSHGNMGYLYLCKGGIHLNSGNNARALEMYDKALVLFEKARDPRGKGYIYQQKGELFFKVGDITSAQVMFNKALALSENGFSVGLGNIYVRLGDINFMSGDNEKALEMYDTAQQFFMKEDDNLGQGNVYMAKGSLYANTGDNSRALEMYEKALPFFEKSGSLYGQGNVYLDKGKFFFKNGDISKAIEMCDKVIDLFRKIGAIDSEFDALYLKANILAQKGKKNEALTLFEKTIFNLEEVRTKTAFSDMKRSFLQNYYNYYENPVLFMLENKYHDKAFKYAESMKARVFLDQMAEGLERPDKGLNPELKEKKDNLVGKLSALSRQMQETPGNEEKKLQELKKQYRQVDAEFDDLLIKIRLESPLYASINYPQPISINDLQTNILKKGETLLSYFISKEKTFVFIVSKEKFRVKELKVTESEINGLVNRHLQAINENNPRDIMKYGSLLHEKLFKPLEKYLKKSRDIIIVPSGELETIPFESLVTVKNKSGHPVFLLEKYRVKYLQSASLLSILRQHYKRDNGTQSFIGFGDPVYEDAGGVVLATEDTESTEETKVSDSLSTSLATSSPPVESEAPDTDTEHEILDIHRDRFARAGGSLPRLPNSGEEVNTIAQLFTQKGQKTRVFLKDQASEANAKTPDLKDFDYIHFSCHGLLNDDFQCLVLSRDAEGKEDGYLTLNEIMNCDFNAKLVVLSACMTGSGKKYKGEGVTGLTRAVMYAGSPAVIASLWKVDDFATKELMVNFYKNLLDKNLDKSEALRLAKLELLNTEKYSSPLYWSAFVLYGE